MQSKQLHTDLPTPLGHLGLCGRAERNVPLCSITLDMGMGALQEPDWDDDAAGVSGDGGPGLVVR